MTTQTLPLKDIHLPPDISLWPLAPGWWMLMALLLVFVVLMARWARRHYRKMSASIHLRRQSQTLLAQYAQDYETNRNAQQLAQNTNALLRRVVLSVGHLQAARYTDDQWVSFIKSHWKNTAPFPPHIDPLLVTQPYTPEPILNHSDLVTCLAQLKQWLDDYIKESHRVVA